MEIKWIKLSVGLATDSKIRYIRMRKNGDQMALLWVLLLCRAGAVNDGGRVYVAPGVPYDAAHMADEFGFPVRVVNDALELFEQLGMIAPDHCGLVIARWNDYQNVEGMERARESARERSARYRANRRDASRDGDVTVTPQKKKGEREGEGEGDFQKDHGIDDAYQTSSRARAKTAQIVVDEIRVRHCFDGATPELHDCVCHALGHGWTPDAVLEMADCGDWGTFASRLMTGGMDVAQAASGGGR